MRARSGILQMDEDIISPADLLLNLDGARCKKAHSKDSAGDDDEEKVVILDYREESELEDREQSEEEPEEETKQGEAQLVGDQKTQMNTASLLYYLLEPILDGFDGSNATIVPFSTIQLVRRLNGLSEMY